MCLNVAAIVWHVTVAASGDVAVYEKATGGLWPHATSEGRRCGKAATRGSPGSA